MAKTRTYSEVDLSDLLKKYYAGEGFAVLTQVRNRTGYGGQERTADAVVVSLWPSHGLWAAGYEIKSYLGDLRRELENPGKAHEISRWMDYWWLVLPDPEWVSLVGRPIPETWGIMAPSADGKRLNVVKKADQLSPQPWTKEFVCSLVRSTARQISADTILKQHLKKAYDEGYVAGREEAEKRRPYEMKELQRIKDEVDRFQAASGVEISSYGNQNLGKAVKLVLDLLGWSDPNEAEAVKEIKRIGGLLVSTAVELDTLIVRKEPG